jgi:hypothetical protein
LRVCREYGWLKASGFDAAEDPSPSALFPSEATFLYGDTGSGRHAAAPRPVPGGSTMSQNRASRRVFPVLIALAALLLASLPVQARPSRSGIRAVAASSENRLARLWSYVANLWTMTKEGMSIDPNGRNGAGATLPAGSGDDEGTSIDPNGRQ